MKHRYALQVPLIGKPRLQRHPTLHSPMRRAISTIATYAAVVLACLGYLALGAALE